MSATERAHTAGTYHDKLIVEQENERLRARVKELEEREALRDAQHWGAPMTDSTSAPRITHIEHAAPGDEQAERATTPSAARHEHYWGNVHGRQFRMTWYSCGWWFVEERDKHGGSWSPIDIDADVTDELARLAGLVPPEDR